MLFNLKDTNIFQFLLAWAFPWRTAVLSEHFDKPSQGEHLEQALRTLESMADDISDIRHDIQTLAHNVSQLTMAVTKLAEIYAAAPPDSQHNHLSAVVLDTEHRSAVSPVNTVSAVSADTADSADREHPPAIAAALEWFDENPQQARSLSVRKLAGIMPVGKTTVSAALNIWKENRS